LDNGVHLLAAGLVLLRAVRVARQRFAWSMVAVGLACFTVGALYAWISALEGVELPFPSVADLCWLLFFPFAYVAIVALLHGEGGNSRTLILLDGFIAGLGAAAVFASVVVGVLIAHTQVGGVVALVALGYPVGDALLLGMVLCVFTVRGQSRGRNLSLLLGMITFAVA